MRNPMNSWSKSDSGTDEKFGLDSACGFHIRLKEEWIETFCVWAESLPYFRELCIDTRVKV